MIVTVVKVVWAVAAIGVCILVLLHSPKGDGLGALGDGAHAVHEHVVLSSLPERAALSAAILRGW